MSKSWVDDTVKVLQLISLPIVIIVTIYGAMQNYLTDFWKGFVIGALLIFFLMLILNFYFYWKGKTRQNHQHIQTVPPVVTTIPPREQTISIDEAKRIALVRVFSEKTEARSDGAVQSAELKGGNWHVSGSWSESTPKSFSVTFFEVVIDAHSKEILKSSYTAGPGLAATKRLG